MKALRIVPVLMTLAMPSAAYAFGGIGCPDLPEYARAQGALQGLTSACDMSVEQARRVIAKYEGTAAPEPQPVHRIRRHHHSQQ